MPNGPARNRTAVDTLARVARVTTVLMSASVAVSKRHHGEGDVDRRMVLGDDVEAVPQDHGLKNTRSKQVPAS